jgi:hypothetical protein
MGWSTAGATLPGGVVHDHPGPEEGDPAHDALDDPAGGAGVRQHTAGHRQQRGAERHQRMDAHAGRLSVHVPVEADEPSCDQGREQAHG